MYMCRDTFYYIIIIIVLLFINLCTFCVGMVPRAVHHLFTGIDNRVGGAEGLSPPPRFTVTAQFMELYNEEIIDLFDSTGDNVR